MTIKTNNDGNLELVFTDAERARDGKWFDIQFDLRSIGKYDPSIFRWVVEPQHFGRVWEIYHTHYGFENKDQLNLF